MRALNGICPYYTMFPLDFPLRHLRDVRKGGWVLDPFCGRGTTAFAARMVGLPSMGFDVNPVAVAIARAKLVNVEPKSVMRFAREILSTQKPDPTPTGRFWRLAYHPDTLADILRLRAGLRGRRGQAASALRGIVLGALHGPQPRTKDSYFSNQMQRTFAPKPDYAVKYWQERGLKAHKVDTLAIIRERAQRFYTDIPPLPESEVLLCDARIMPRHTRRYAAVVTSPPYFGMDTYVPDQWLRYWFIGGSDRPEYRGEEQLSRGTADDFVAELAKVWHVVARVVEPGAKLVIRFGGIRSRKGDPELLLRRSLTDSGSPWRIHAVRPAGNASNGRRQADQMGAKVNATDSQKEIDVVCFLRRRSSTKNIRTKCNASP